MKRSLAAHHACLSSHLQSVLLQQVSSLLHMLLRLNSICEHLARFWTHYMLSFLAQELVTNCQSSHKQASTMWKCDLLDLYSVLAFFQRPPELLKVSSIMQGLKDKNRSSFPYSCVIKKTLRSLYPCEAGMLMLRTWVVKGGAIQWYRHPVSWNHCQASAYLKLLLLQAIF